MVAGPRHLVELFMRPLSKVVPGNKVHEEVVLDARVKSEDATPTPMRVNRIARFAVCFQFGLSVANQYYVQAQSPVFVVGIRCQMTNIIPAAASTVVEAHAETRAQGHQKGRRPRRTRPKGYHNVHTHKTS